MFQVPTLIQKKENSYTKQPNKPKLQREKLSIAIVKRL